MRTVMRFLPLIKRISFKDPRQVGEISWWEEFYAATGIASVRKGTIQMIKQLLLRISTASIRPDRKLEMD